MSNLWVEIEALVLDGVPMNMVQGRRLAQLTEIALTHLLEQRGISAKLESGAEQEKKESDAKRTNMDLPEGVNEARWAEELALVLYRAMDRTF